MEYNRFTKVGFIICDLAKSDSVSRARGEEELGNVGSIYWDVDICNPSGDK
jgi:hypothetical protein